MSNRYVECYKTLVNCFNDFGQWAANDTFLSEKPFSPWEKVIDNCSLSSLQTMTVKQYQPL